MHFIRTASWWVIGGAFLIGGTLLAGTFAPIAALPAMRIVLSGSMEPKVPVGSVVFIMPDAGYAVGDVITFGEGGAKIPTTHRVTGVERAEGSLRYLTKGDANEEADLEGVAHSAVLGKVVLTVPRLGYIFDFARTQKGFLLMVVIPSALIILDELLTIFAAVRGRRRERVGKTFRGGSEVYAEERSMQGENEYEDGEERIRDSYAGTNGERYAPYAARSVEGMRVVHRLRTRQSADTGALPHVRADVDGFRVILRTA